MRPNKKKQQQKEGSKVARPSLSHRISDFFKDRHPVLKYLLGFIGCMVVFYLFYYSAFYKNVLEGPFLEAQARISNGLLRLLGHATNVDNAIILSDEFAVNIKNGCDGLEAMAILVSGILIFPASFKLKMHGILLGVAALFLLNLVRIAGLYLIGLYFSTTVFEIMHVQGGFILFTMISVVFLLVWINWTVKKAQG